MRPTHVPTLLLIAIVAVTSACGDDEPASGAPATPAPTSGPATSAAPTIAEAESEPEVCAIAAEIDASGGPPTLEMIERYRDAAPDELREPTQLVIDALEAADGDFMAIFSDPLATAAIEEIDTMEAALCGSPVDDGPAQDPSVTVVDAAATRIDVVATEHEFAVDLPSTPGRYSFVMTNDGSQPHLMVLLRLEDGAVIGDVLASEGETGVAETFESSFAPPGAEGVLTADLGPGQWVVLCPIPGEQGRPHFADGMIEEFTVG